MSQKTISIAALITSSIWAGCSTMPNQHLIKIIATAKREIVRVGAVVNTVSQIIKAYGVLKIKDLLVLPGMSGTATFSSIGS